MKVERVSVDILHCDPANVRKHGEKNLKAIKASLTKFGQQKPIVVDAKNIVLAGNGTLAAAKELGWAMISIVRTELTGTDATGYAISDNRTSELAEWDFNGLAKQLAELDIAGFDLAEFGFDPGDIPGMDEPKPGLTDDDAVPDVAQNEFNVQRGQIWQLGEHRLMCGDSTNAEDVAILMNGANADMVFTDPPYNYEDQNKGGGHWGMAATKVGEKIEHISTFDPSAFLELLPRFFKDHFCAYVFCNTTLVRDYLNWSVSQEKRFSILTWHKTQFIPANSNHHFSDTEYCIYIAKRPIFNSGLSPDHYRKYWIEDREMSENHPTLKPQTIIIPCIELNSRMNSIIADPFLGSGSTLIACEKTNRKCYGMEIDPHYCSVIIKRWQDFTGKKAELCT